MLLPLLLGPERGITTKLMARGVAWPGPGCPAAKRRRRGATPSLLTYPHPSTAGNKNNKGRVHCAIDCFIVDVYGFLIARIALLCVLTPQLSLSLHSTACKLLGIYPSFSLCLPSITFFCQ